jgi:hypothetical protein
VLPPSTNVCHDQMAHCQERYEALLCALVSMHTREFVWLGTRAKYKRHSTAYVECVEVSTRCHCTPYQVG